MEDMSDAEMIGIRKIRLVKQGKGATAVVGSFANADNFLTAWCNASRGWLRCKFEIEYLDEHVLKGEFKTFRKKDSRVSLSHHIRSTLCKALKNMEILSGPEAVFDGIGIQFGMEGRNSAIGADFLERYETADFYHK